MNARWAPVLGIFAAVAVLVTGVVIVVMATGAPPGAEPRATAYLTELRVTGRSGAVTGSTVARGSMSHGRVPPPRPTLTVDSGCRVGQGPPRLAEVPRDVTGRVNRAWERIEKWLAANAPATAATLAPPATPDQIAAAQRQVGVPLPAELIASLLRHDGTGKDMRAGFSLPPFYVPMSARHIADDATMMCDVLASSGIDGNVGSWWHGQVVPFAFDGGGGHLLLDQRPGRGGRLGEHDEESDMRFEDYPRTITELLEQTAQSLERGSVVLGHYRPKVVAGGTLDWDIS